MRYKKKLQAYTIKARFFVEREEADMDEKKDYKEGKDGTQHN